VSFEEEDTCVLCLSCLLHQLTPRAGTHMRRRIHVSFEEEDTCVF